MCNKTDFLKAHALARKIHVKGDDYRVTFGQCLKAVREAMPNQHNTVFLSIEQEPKKIGYSLAFILTLVLIVSVIIFTEGVINMVIFTALCLSVFCLFLGVGGYVCDYLDNKKG